MEPILKSFKFVAIVWGSDFVDSFLNVCLPSQLFPGNLIYFSQKTNSTYRIYTSAKDVEVILKSKSYRDLSDLMPVEIAVISGLSYIGKYQAMTECNAHFIQSSGGDDCAFIFMSPDIVWADGAFTRLLEIYESGKRMVLAGTVRLLKDTFISELKRQYSQNNILQPMTSRQLVRLALDHLHPITLSQFWNVNEARSTHFGHLVWPVGDEGLIVRQFHLFPLLVKSADKNVVPIRSTDDDYTINACPDFDDVYVVEDSDEMCFMDFTSSSQVNEVIDVRDPNLIQSIGNIAKWAKLSTNKRHREFLRCKINLHWNDFSREWVELGKSSDEVIEAILSLVEEGHHEYAPIPLSNQMHLSIDELVVKFRSMGAIGFLQKIFSRLYLFGMKIIYGPNVRIKIIPASVR